MKSFNCNLCPRHCNKVRNNKIGLGFCELPNVMRVARIAPHYWEEPCISGTKGTGAVFFSGCTLRCIYCQNAEISQTDNGTYISENELSQKLMEMENSGVHNISFITATPFIPNIVKAIELYRPSIPLIWNCGGYEDISSLKELSGLIDVYLPDFKYGFDDLAMEYSKCNNYVSTTLSAIDEMIKQVGTPQFDSNGMITGGVIVRHLVLPNNTKNSLKVMDILSDNFGDKILVSLMGQYIPHHKAINNDKLNRKITPREYSKVLDYLINKGLDGFAQELDSADENYIPTWNL